MQKSTLIQTMALLTPAERQEISIFLQCPLYNDGKHARSILAFFTLLGQEMDKNKGAGLDKNRLYEALFPGKTYRQGYFENLMSELLALIRQYLTQREVQRQWGPSFEGLAMARFYRARGLSERAQQAVQRAKTDLAAVRTDAGESRLLHYWLEQEVCKQACLNNQRKGDLNVSAALRTLTVFYGHQLLELASVLEQQQRVVPGLSSAEWSPFIEQFREMLRAGDSFGDPAIRVLDEALQLLNSRPENPGQALDLFLALFRAQETALPDSLQKILAAYVRNFTAQHGHAFDSAFRFGLYREHLEKGWLCEQGKLPPSYFINAVNIALSAGEMPWLETFLREYRDKIEGEQADCLLLYGFARYYFQLRQWDNVDNSIREIRKLPKLTDIGLEKLTRILEIKTCYEQNPEGEHLENMLNSFHEFIQRNHHAIVEKHRGMDKNFIHVVRQMMRLRRQRQFKKTDAAKLQKLAHQVHDPGFLLAERDWLRQKLAQFQAAGPTSKAHQTNAAISI